MPIEKLVSSKPPVSLVRRPGPNTNEQEAKMSRAVSGTLLAKLVAMSRRMAQPLRELGGCMSSQGEPRYDEEEVETLYFAEQSEIDELEKFSLDVLRVCHEMRRYITEKSGEGIQEGHANQPGQVAGEGQWDSTVITLANALAARLAGEHCTDDQGKQLTYFGPREVKPHEEIRERLPGRVLLAIKDLHEQMREYVSPRWVVRTDPSATQAMRSLLTSMPIESPGAITRDQAIEALYLAHWAEWQMDNCRRALGLLNEGIPKKSREAINLQRLPAI